MASTSSNPQLPALTPDSRPSPNLCRSASDLRVFLSRNRILDDSITVYLNRTLAKFRDAKLAFSPSLLSSPYNTASSSAVRVAGSSSTAPDLGTSTYSQLPEAVCQAAFREIAEGWIRREDTIRYCMSVVASDQAGQAQAAQQAEVGGKFKNLRGKEWDDRPARGESKEEMLQRILANERTVESIIRHRSLDVFRSRCSFFTPHFEPNERGERERRLWTGGEASL